MNKDVDWLNVNKMTSVDSDIKLSSTRFYFRDLYIINK